MAENEKTSERVIVQARTDRATKKAVVATFKEMGMDLSTGINIYLKQVARDGRLPFTPSTTDSLDASLADALADVKNGRVDHYATFAEYKAAMNKL